MTTQLQPLATATKRLIASILVLSLIAIGVYLVAPPQIQKSQPAQPVVRGDRDVRLQANASDAETTDVYLVDRSGAEVKFITLAEVYRDHYHAAEFVDGNLYVIKRIGLNKAYPSDSINWTDELWRFATDGKGQKLHAAQGLDFRVSAEEDLIAVLLGPGTAGGPTIVLMDLDGKLVKTLSSADLGVSADVNMNPLLWQEGLLWFSTNQAIALFDLVSVNTSDFTVTKQDLSTLQISGSEFALRPSGRLLVFSDYKSNLEADPPVRDATLFLYDLTTKTQTQLVTVSTSRPFEPSWVDDKTIEYNDPDGAGRITLELP
jgi:hypothetical protein